MDEHGERIGRNEALFRDLNERVEEISRSLDDRASEATFICECGRADCMERIRVDLADYERVRADATLFFVRPGHISPEVEEVVEEHEGWWIVCKLAGEAAEIADALDPRS